jgi:hypothetical protein
VVQPQTPSGPHTRSSVATQVTASQAPEDDPLAQAKRALLQPKFDIRKLHNDGDPKAESDLKKGKHHGSAKRSQN